MCVCVCVCVCVYSLLHNCKTFKFKSFPFHISDIFLLLFAFPRPISLPKLQCPPFHIYLSIYCILTVVIWCLIPKLTKQKITLTCVKSFFQRSKVYQVTYDCHFMLNQKIPFIVLSQVWITWILHSKLHTITEFIQKPADSTCHSWSWVTHV